ncbi:hypothetical protein HMPREF1429_01615 [Helicobacter pylori GAM93Bi]|nr:hypothetical protein HMPREF1429_01615 [Helicobacter pylori GAM93Bi]
MLHQKTKNYLYYMMHVYSVSVENTAISLTNHKSISNLAAWLVAA